MISVEQAIKEEVKSVVDVLSYLKSLDSLQCEELISAIKNLKGMHSDKWSSLFDYMSEKGLITNYATVLLMLAENGHMSQIQGILKGADR